MFRCAYHHTACPRLGRAAAQAGRAGAPRWPAALSQGHAPGLTRSGAPAPTAPPALSAGSTPMGGDACILDRGGAGGMNVCHGSGLAAPAGRAAPAVADVARPGRAARRDRRHRADRRGRRPAHRHRLPPLPAPEQRRGPAGEPGAFRVRRLFPSRCPPAAGVVAGDDDVPADVPARPARVAVLGHRGRGQPHGRRRHIPRPGQGRSRPHVRPGRPARGRDQISSWRTWRTCASAARCT